MWGKKRNSSPLKNPLRDTEALSSSRQTPKLSPLILYPDSLASLGGLGGGEGRSHLGKENVWLSWENVGHFCLLSPKEEALGGTNWAQGSRGGTISLKLVPKGLRMTGEGWGRAQKDADGRTGAELPEPPGGTEINPSVGSCGLESLIKPVTRA